ncbi:DUF7093 family protein [Haloarchaeobius sp. DT45]|uniref:DUF7093 family protein n=1 Tax=Haloarchaeobius sp. DT45 TaxID=3446116 RepID=UPI003F6A6D16
MGLRCSLLGHDWSETEIEDERDEQGNEVVMTVREYEVCSRCGEKTLISENTEVTSVSASRTDETAGIETDEAESDADAVAAEVVAEATESEGEETADAAVDTDGVDEPADDADERIETADGDAEIVTDDGVADDGVADDAGIEADEESPADDEEVTAAPDDDAMIIDAGDDTAANEADADAGEVADEHIEDADDAEPHEKPETDDGVILADDPADDGDERERQHGEWPEHETGQAAAATETREWPEHGGEDDGYDATVSDGEPADVEFEGGHPQSDAGEPEDGHDAEFIDNATARSTDHETDQRARSAAQNSPTGIASASEAQAPGTGTPSRSGGDLVCPACDNTELASRTSLRAGDICPECKRGYLAESGQ